MKTTSLRYGCLFALVFVASQGQADEGATAALTSSVDQTAQYLRKASSVKDSRELQGGSVLRLLFTFLASLLPGFQVPIFVTTPAPETTTTTTTTSSTTTAEPVTTTTTPEPVTTTTTTTSEPTTTTTTTTTTPEPTTTTTTTTGAPLSSTLDTIRTLSASDGDKFSISLQFIEATTSLANDLSQSSGPFTAFIPTDDQLNVLFNQLSIEGTTQARFGRVVVGTSCLISAGSLVVDALLEYFIVEGALIKEADFTNGPLTTRSGGTIDVEVGGEVTLTSNPNRTITSTIASFDNLASNGVVHELAGILSPPISDDLRFSAGLACFSF